MRVVSTGGNRSQSVKPASIASMSESSSAKSEIPASGMRPRIGSGAWEKPPTGAAPRHDGKVTLEG